MNYRCLSVALTAAMLLLGAGLSSANDTDTRQPAATKVDANSKSAKANNAAKHQHAARVKLVDINHATKDELKKLPGIGDTEADKIIAARPFGSKASLATNNIIPMETYRAVKGMIVCKLSKTEIKKIMAQDRQK